MEGRSLEPVYPFVYFDAMLETESAHFWLSVLDELKGRGGEDILVACMDGLSGLKEAIEAVFPNTKTQRCIIHLIRNATTHVGYKDRKSFCAGLKEIYSAVVGN